MAASAKFKEDASAEPRLVGVHSQLAKREFVARKPVNAIDGSVCAYLAQAPAMVLTHAVRRLRGTPLPSRAEREEALRRAGDLYRSATLRGLTPEAYVEATMAVTGLPRRVCETSLETIATATADACAIAALGLPKDAAWEPRASAAWEGCAQLMRRGDVLAVIAPGNGPGVHALWPQALALGYKVAVRPSEREPFTAERLIAAMAQAGLGDHVAFLPCSHDDGAKLVEAADLSLVYGGEETVARYRGDPSVLVQGPGRSKIVVGRDCPRDAALDLVFRSVTGLGGAACVCASAVLVEEDAVGFAEDLRAYVEARFRDDESRTLWATRFSRARVDLARAINAKAKTTAPFETIEAGERGTHVMPLVWTVEAGDPAIAQEWPMAAVSIAPFDRARNLAAIGPALVVTLATGDETLISAVARLPDIRNLYIGDVPTTWMRPHVPHDGFLNAFLVTTRGYRLQSTFHAAAPAD